MLTEQRLDNDYIIFSIDNEDDPLKREQFELRLTKLGIGFKPLLGSYKGEQENSYIINAQHLAWLEASPYIMRQESILFLFKEKDARGKRKASLGWLKNGLTVAFQAAGWFGSTTKQKALSGDAWTLDKDTYYVTTSCYY